MQWVEETQWYGGWRFFAPGGRRGCAERVPAFVHKYQCTREVCDVPRAIEYSLCRLVGVERSLQWRGGISGRLTI